MNYEHLFSFAVFAEHLSFTHAARRLALSQPALHVQVKKLSADVGVPLYTRRGKVLALTPAGERVAVFAREVHAKGDALVTELRGKADDGAITLATGAFAFVRLLAPAVRKLGRGGSRLRLVTANADSAAQAGPRGARRSRGHRSPVRPSRSRVHASPHGGPTRRRPRGARACAANQGATT
jgi:DNA-binding transcriptional LysR family regulator